MIGRTVSHYRIIEKLGEGGMGVVYKAEDIKLKRIVALKFLPVELTKDEEAKERFVQEAQAASALEHPNICAVYEIDETPDGRIFIVMGCYEGRTLKEMISGVGAIHESPLRIDTVIAIAVQIAGGLAAAHAKGIVHRDIKPANIILTHEGVVKIVDFGLAKLKGQVHLTKKGITLGTIAYMSPEQLNGEEADARTDLWSLGVVFYEMLAGRLPFRGEVDQAMIFSILHDEADPVAELGSDIPPEVTGIVDKLLEKDPEVRYQNAGDLIVDLKRSKRDSKPGSVSGMGKGKKGKRQIRALLAVSALILLTVIVVLFQPFKGKKPVGPKRGADAGTAVPVQGKSIAVLPFRDASSSQDQEYLCFGMTDNIGSMLGRIGDLQVVPTTAVLKYKGSTLGPREIGRELRVGAMLEGSLQKEGKRIRVSAKLTDTQSGFQIWSETYDRELKVGEIFAIQDDLSRSIASQLKVTLAAGSIRVMEEPHPQNLEAYENYLKGMFYINSRYTQTMDRGDFAEGVRLFEKAISVEPGYALAYVGLAWAYFHLYDLQPTQDPALMTRALAACETAFRLNPDLAETKAAIGFVRFFQGRLDEMHRSFREALALNPRNMLIHLSIGYCLRMLDLPANAIRFFRRAEEIDPDYVMAYVNEGYSLKALGQWDLAETCFKRAMLNSPNDIFATVQHAYILTGLKRFDEAESDLKRLSELHPDYPYLNRFWSILWAARGDRARVLRDPAALSAPAYSLLGMKKEALDLLSRRNFDEEGFTPYAYLALISNPFYENIRSDPRFQKIVREQKRVYEERVGRYGDL